MVIQFTLQGLMIFLVCALGIAAGILLIPILWNINKMVGNLRTLVETNQEFINKTIKTMPGTFENAGQISSNVRETTDKLKISVPAILQEVEYVTNAAKESIELAGVVIENVGSGINETIATYKKDTQDYVAYFHIFEEVLQIIYRTFTSRK
jgi:predicted PurR-regulated permease PerM